MTARQNSLRPRPAVRLIRDQDIGRPSPRLTSVIAGSVALIKGVGGNGLVYEQVKQN